MKLPLRAPLSAYRGAFFLRQYRTTPVRQIARKLNKVELRFFVRVHKFDAGGLTPGKENLCAMTENMQADDVQRRKPRVVRCCLKIFGRKCISVSFPIRSQTARKL